MNKPDPYQHLRSGAAWSEFCTELNAIGQEMLAPGRPDSPQDVAEAYRFLTQMVRSSFELIVEGGDPAYPWLSKSLHETQKSGWDNPDNIHHNAYINEAFTYRLSGQRGEAHYLSFAVYGGSYSKDQAGRSTIAYVELSELEVNQDGSFEIILSREPHPGNWIQLKESTTTLMIRETFWDRRVEKPGRFKIERIAPELPKQELSPKFMDSALHRASRFIKGSNRLFFHFSDGFRKDQRNKMVLSEVEGMKQNCGIPDNTMATGWFVIEDDEAAVIEFTPPNCYYWMFVLSDYWGCSFDYRQWPIHINKRTAGYRKDGTVRIVISKTDPALADSNWLASAGHNEGVMQFRWIKCAQPLAPEIKIVKLAGLVPAFVSGVLV